MVAFVFSRLDVANDEETTNMPFVDVFSTTVGNYNSQSSLCCLEESFGNNGINYIAITVW